MSAPAVLDVGTGSGAIALAIAEELPGARVTAADISPAALDLARANGADLGLDGRVGASPTCWLRWPGRRFDLIVSNPPYIAAAELETLEPEVRTWEPRSRPLPGEDGLELLLALARVGAGSAQSPAGWLALECGAGQAGAVAEALATAAYTDVGVREDFAGIERFVIGRRP